MRVKKNIKWLTTIDLETFISKFADMKTKAAFIGVFPIDHLPEHVPVKPALFIVNTNPSNLPGQHWKAIYISADLHGEVFDSLAMPLSLNLQRWLNSHTKKWTMSNLTLQNPLSPTCGAYVLFYIMNRLKYDSLKSCIASFTNNVIKNDAIVKRFYKNAMK